MARRRKKAARRARVPRPPGRFVRFSRKEVPDVVAEVIPTRKTTWAGERVLRVVYLHASELDPGHVFRIESPEEWCLSRLERASVKWFKRQPRKLSKVADL